MRCIAFFRVHDGAMQMDGGDPTSGDQFKCDETSAGRAAGTRHRRGEGLGLSHENEDRHNLWVQVAQSRRRAPISGRRRLDNCHGDLECMGTVEGRRVSFPRYTRDAMHEP